MSEGPEERGAGDGRAGARLGDALASLVAVSRRRAGPVLLLAVLLTGAAGGLAATRLGVNADTDALFAEDLEFRRLRAELDHAIPAQRDALLVVLDAPDARGAERAAEALAARARAETDFFRGAFAPGAGPFFERHGLLYLSREELEAFVDDLVAAQPFLAALARDPSLRGVFEQLALALRHAAGAAGAREGLLLPRLEQVGEALESAARLEARPEAFGALRLRGEADDTRRFVVVTPRVDFGAFAAGREAVERLRALARELDFEARGVRMRLTGDLALQAEELGDVRDQAVLAGAVSFVLVAAILAFALRSLRLVLATVGTLAMGLAWTAGFAALAVGRLNIISVAFAVLFIGLGVDFGIHFALRYRELCAGGAGHEGALGGTARSVGSSLALCALTTAIGFLAFLPTDYRGVAELGLISAAGMGISWVATLTVLPALLSVGRGAPPPARTAPADDVGLPALPARAPVAVCVLALLVAAGSALLLPGLRFDANPLRVRDPSSEAVRTFQELLDDARVNPWSIDVLAPDLATADALAARLETLAVVARAETLSDQVPADQTAKLALLEDAAFLLPLDAIRPLPPPDPAQVRAALAEFGDALQETARAKGALAEAARALGPELEGFRRALRAGKPGEEVLLEVLRASLVEPVVERLERLRSALQAGPVAREDLPPPLRAQLLAEDGRARVMVFPEDSLRDDDALARFVSEVRALAPGATGTSAYMFDAERTVVRALKEAFGLALVLVAALLAVLWRSGRDAALVLAPLLLAALLTAGVAVLVELPVNFANVIVLPLLLGIGVDSGIHLVHRHRLGAGSALLETSTSRAVLWSGLTTLASFGSLAFSAHRGMASLGQLLALGIAATLLANLLFLPALLALVDRKRSS